MKKKIEALAVELKEETDELARLREQMGEVKAQIAELKGNRAAAVRLAAKGDDKAAESAQDIDAKLAKLQIRFDGFAGLVADLEHEVETLQQKVTQAEGAYANGRRQFVEDGLKKKAQELLDGLPDQKEKFLGLYVQMCLTLGEMHRSDSLVENILGRNDFYHFIRDFELNWSDSIRNSTARKLSVREIDIKLKPILGVCEPHLVREPSPEILRDELIAEHQRRLDAEFDSK